jgi:hypothetical protein
VQVSLKWVRPGQFEAKNPIAQRKQAEALYLYWACHRGVADVVCYIIDVLRISPFHKTYGGRSALMAAVEGKSLEVQEIICQREFIYKTDQGFLDRQMQETDGCGNNTLHFAFRSRKDKSI